VDLKTLAFQATTSNALDKAWWTAEADELGRRRRGEAVEVAGLHRIQQQSGFQPTAEPTAFQAVVILCCECMY
jgi:hypothetical protein